MTQVKLGAQHQAVRRHSVNVSAPLSGFQPGAGVRTALAP